ncbi:MAG: hypothetical protein KUG77_06475 [Nannocystaceae bacterium]|nr:hypothetical protein [Nannocystaceae bacterium]
MSGSSPATARLRLWVGVLVAMLGLFYASQSVGLVSSNDGSHVALGRALVHRGKPSITPEVGLTLWIDRAVRDGVDYSDRPPGTAFAALPAIWVGSQLDGDWGRESIDRLKAGANAEELDSFVAVRPATDRYIATYGKRRLEMGVRSPNLIELQGTALWVGLHAAAMGALGLAGLLMLLRRRELEPAGQFVVVLAVGVGTLWGPYSTMLFSHVTAGAMLVWCVWGLETLSLEGTPPQRWRSGLVAGACGAWAVSADYALVVAVVPLVLLVGPFRESWRVVLGATPVVIATALYHDAAFGSPLSIGYDHHATFAFATSRAATFSGDPLRGLWSLWGAGQGAGALVMAPILLVAAGGMVLERRIGLALVPWALLLCFHRTPTGGAGEDHRYLVPVVAVLGLGLGGLWRWSAGLPPSRTRLLRVSVVVLTAVSAVLVWSHFFAWRG